MKIIIPGKPIPKARARYSKRGKHVITYDPQESDKKHVRDIMTSQLIDIFALARESGDLETYEISIARVFSVQFIFFLPINSSDSVVTKNKKLWGIIPASTKPDYDNLEKFYLDCANTILWGDDSMIVKAKAMKLYSEEPRVEMVVNAIEDVKLSESVESVLNTFSPFEFNEFREMHTKIARLQIMDVYDLDSAARAEWLTTLACVLNEFAIKFAPKLTKIAKLGDIKSEVKNLQEFKLSL